MMRYRFLFLTILLFGFGAFMFSWIQSTQPHPLHIPLTSTQALTFPSLNRTTPAVVFGFLPYWTYQRAQLPKELTHISFFSIPILPNGHLIQPDGPHDPGYRAMENGALERIRANLQPTQHLELTLTLLEQEKIPVLLQDKQAANTLVADLKTLRRQHRIDGITIDVEYIKQLTPEMQQSFTSFIKTVSTLMKQSDPSFHISIATLVDAASEERLTKVPALVPFIDHFIVMAYDFHRSSSERSGPNAPLYGKDNYLWGRDIMKDMKSYIASAPSSQILLGVPFYGYEWSVTSTDPETFTIPSSGRTATYERVQSLMQNGKITRGWDDISLTPYLHYTKGNQLQQIYYEDERSLSYKIDLVNQAQLDGIAIWALGFEGKTRDLWTTIHDRL
jgi:spore germination protein YaaH